MLILAGFGVAVVRLLVDSARAGGPARQAVARGTSFSALLIVAAFLINRNIFNSDNYRYLIFLLIPWSLGFGLVMHRLAHRGIPGRLAAYIAAGLLALIMSERTFTWYRDTRHYLDDRGVVVRIQPSPWTDLSLRTPAPKGKPSGPVMPPFDRTMRFEVPSDVTHVFGGYWDVYRMAFVSGRRVVGIPFPMYPNRFPGWSEGLGPDRGKLLIVRPNDDSNSGRGRLPRRQACDPASSARRSESTGGRPSRRSGKRTVVILRRSSIFRSSYRNSIAQGANVSRGESESGSSERLNALFQRRTWGRGDVLALVVWTLAIAAFFWDVVGLRRALFYFDITEINYPYRAFFAEELRAGRFSRWFPGLYCGLPLYSESQAGYLHPLKYLLYPWLATWQALNLDTVLSIWLTGVGAYGWLRRHVGPAGALSGAAILAVGGFTWAHLVHTSMINSLASLPFVIWGLEWSWESRRLRGSVLGGVALACQVFAGHLQDALFTVVLVVLYGLYRAATERGLKARLVVLTMALVLVGEGVLISAVQWVPSKELLDRSPRAGGLSWRDLVFGSWHPELIPTLVVREAYGTRARDTDWLDGFYPYHEMDTYLGLIAMALAVVGAGGVATRDRWASFWVFLVGLGAILMLGKFTFLFDQANLIPVLGSSREPVRFSLWVSLGVAALAAVGVERLGRPGAVSLRGAMILAGVLVSVSIPIMIYIYHPVWTDPKRWTLPYHLDRYRWLGRELFRSTIRTGIVVALGWWIAWSATRSTASSRRARWAALLPLLVMADLLGAHWFDVPTAEPRYWTAAPESVQRLKSDQSLIRVFGIGDKSAGEPGYASERVNFLPVRDPLDWSLPSVWHVLASKGNTPMRSQRLHVFEQITQDYPWRHDLESTSHIVTGRNPELRMKYRHLPAVQVGTAFIHRNARALPRARLVGNPAYADDLQQAAIATIRLGARLRDHVVVEDPSRPLPTGATVSGTARIIEDLPEQVVAETEAAMPAYLVLADTFDPGWSATVDGQSVPIWPAYIAFRAVYLPAGNHKIVFTYRPAGFVRGLGLTGFGIFLGLILWFFPPWMIVLSSDHLILGWPSWWRRAWFLTLGVVVLASVLTRGSSRQITLQSRWTESVHTHTWGSGREAMKEHRM